ncbi:MAG: bifunctional phosphoglucose/phosphomannose isomerase [Thermoplasmata archaeon]|nr:bifunctional phosphoglucose/phosphomannose isomerase [Thermoplasmata archaeon]
MLDDINLIKRIDCSDMLGVVENFPNQINEAASLAEDVNLDSSDFSNIIIGGMGGSGISGDITEIYFKDKSRIPVYVNKDYNLPSWVDKKTLVFVISYSGNTEESLCMLKHALNKKATIIGISSDGVLERLCYKNNLYHVKVPRGFQPRAALAYLLFPTLYILGEILEVDLSHEIKDVIESTSVLKEKNKRGIPSSENQAKQIASRLYNRIPQLYGWGIFSPVAKRWRTQLNENSKVIAREDILPECNHNDIVGWSYDKETARRFACVLFRDKGLEDISIGGRLDFLKNMFLEVAGDVIEINSIGRGRLAKIISTIYLGDFVSCYLAVLRNVDPTPVDVITKLKEKLRRV